MVADMNKWDASKEGGIKAQSNPPPPLPPPPPPPFPPSPFPPPPS